MKKGEGSLSLWTLFAHTHILAGQLGEAIQESAQFAYDSPCPTHCCPHPRLQASWVV